MVSTIVEEIAEIVFHIIVTFFTLIIINIQWHQGGDSSKTGVIQMENEQNFIL